MLTEKQIEHLKSARIRLKRRSITRAEADFMHGMYNGIVPGLHWSESHPLYRVDHLINFMKIVRPKNSITINFGNDSFKESHGKYHMDHRIYSEIHEYPTIAVALAVIKGELEYAALLATKI
jgi:hypothetical protein